jgi:uncharacterized protein
MTIGITGPRRRAPWRGALAALIVAAIVGLICLILLGLTGNFLIDWLWFSALGYWGVFWTTVVAEAAVFFAAFVATVIILWLNGSLAYRFARSLWMQRPADFAWKRGGVATPADPLEFVRHRLPWPLIIPGGAGFIAMLVGWGEVHNWDVFLRFFYQVPYGASDPLYDRDIGFYLFSLPAYSYCVTNFGICSEPRSMGNAIVSWQERPPVSVALLQSSSERGVQVAMADPLDW